MSFDQAGPRGGWSHDETLRLYGAHRVSLVRLAVLLVDDVPTAEDVVQDAFAGFRGRSRTLGDPDEALAYLRTAVLHTARSVRRRRAERGDPAGHEEHESVEPEDLTREQRALLAAARSLPDRQREVLVLQLWWDLDDLQVADVLRTSRSTVRRAAAEGLERVAALLEDAP